MLVVTVAGCASTSEVQERGKNRYIVSATMGGQLPRWDEVEQLALEKAKSHCQGMGKQVEVENQRNSGARGWSPLTVRIDFRCD